VERLAADDTVARVKQGRRCQSDALAGGNLGASVGYAAAGIDRFVVWNQWPHGRHDGVCA
jgi:hypothetical protein